MLRRLALGAAFAVTVSVTGAALAQAPGAGSPAAGSPAAGQGLSGPPGSQSAGDVAKPPSASREILPRSFVPPVPPMASTPGVTRSDPGRPTVWDQKSP
jgi:hypothetical protein